MMVESLKDALLAFDKARATEILLATSKANNLDDVFRLVTTCLAQIGAEWARGEISLAQEYMSCRICEEVVDQMLPANQADGNFEVAVTTIDDFHLLGKKILCSVLKSAGYPVFEYYPTGDIEKLARELATNKHRIVMVSALMLHTAYKVRELRAELVKLDFDAKIIVGGAPFYFDKLLWQDVGADAMGTEPTDGVQFIKQWKEKL